MTSSVKPDTKVSDWPHGILIQVSCGDVDPSKIRLFVAPTELLLLAPFGKAGLDRWLFGYLRFETPIDVEDASAHFHSGSLSISASRVNAPEEAKLRFHVA